MGFGLTVTFCDPEGAAAKSRAAINPRAQSRINEVVQKGDARLFRISHLRSECVPLKREFAVTRSAQLCDLQRGRWLTRLLSSSLGTAPGQRHFAFEKLDSGSRTGHAPEPPAKIPAVRVWPEDSVRTTGR